jgi:acetyltransferase
VRGLIKGSGIRCIGPNSLSPVNTARNFIIGFGPAENQTHGRLSFIFQSGLYQPRLNYLLNEMHINLNKLVDLGNKMDVNEVDALEYFKQDESTQVIAMHLESVAGDARSFFQLLKEITPHKPILVLKSGRTPAGAKAASSHTGAIIKASDVVFDTALRQAGAIRVQGLDEFFDLAKTFEYCPPLTGNRIAIASFSGGEGVITTDFCQLNGLELARPTLESVRKLHSVFPSWEIPVNPFDTGVSNQFNPGQDVVSFFMDTLADDPNVDCMAIQMGGPPQLAGIMAADRAEKVAQFYRSVVQRGKLVAVWMIDPRFAGDTIRALEAARIPVFPSAERAVRAMGALHRYHQIRQRALSD